MKRALMFGAVAFCVAAVAAIVMSLLPFQGETRLILPIVVGLLTAFALMGVSGNRKVVTVSAQERQSSLTAPPPAGSGVVWIYREGFVGKAVGYDVAVDGQVAAQLKSPASTRLVLTAGSHVVSAALPGPPGAMSPNPAQLTLDVAAGQTQVYRLSMKMGALKNTLLLEPQSDVDGAMKKLSGTPMVAPLTASA